MQGLETSRVFKCLEKKTLILGFEIIDLFALSFLLCLLNFVFADASLKLFWTFGPTLMLAAILKLAKSGKADGFLLHWIRFHISPGVFRAFPKASNDNLLRQLKQKGTKRARFYFG